MGAMPGIDPSNFGDKKGQNLIMIIAIIAIVIIIFLVIYEQMKVAGAITDKLGLTDDPATQATNARLAKNIDVAENADYWKPTMWKSKPSAKVFTMSTAKNLCDLIYGSVGYFKDNPAQAVAAFKQVKYRTQISFLVDQFYKLYQLDLKIFLNERFDTTEQKKALNDIYNYVSLLPAGY